LIRLNIYKVYKQTLQESKISSKEIKAIAVTYGPGLAGSLLVGINFAKGLSMSLYVPLIGVNHLEGHIMAALIRDNKLILDLDNSFFPSLCLLISGGHTELILMKSYDKFSLIGQTRDDAVGEAYDKVSRLLGLGYPGGPIIEKMAKNFSNKNRYVLPRAWLNDSYEFSFSGLKTATMNLTNKELFSNNLNKVETQKTISDISYAFQESVFDVLFSKTTNAATEFSCKNILISGGVAANGFLRENFLSKSSFKVIFPEKQLCTDNGIMIASRGLIDYLKNKKLDENLEVTPQLNIL
ncbi:uncharacterized protein METZ01_LOCUS334698, partial [marine metagenome]